MYLFNNSCTWKEMSSDSTSVVSRVLPSLFPFVDAPSNTKWTSSLARSWTDHTSSRSITASTSASPLSTHSCTPYTHSTEHHNTFTHPHKTNHIYSHSFNTVISTQWYILKYVFIYTMLKFHFFFFSTSLI